MDILYIFKQNEANDSEELRYSLRSLKNIPHGKVVIAGEKPEWVKNVIHIPVEQSDAKHRNGQRNRAAAIESGVLSSQFILMNDDFFIMKPISTIPNIHHGDMKSLIGKYYRRYPEGSTYISIMESMYEVLISEGVQSPVSYELHTPMVLDIDKVKSLYDKFGVGNIYQFRSRYGNYYNVGGREEVDVKLFNNPTHNRESYNDDPKSYMERMTFISTTGGSFDHGEPGEFIKRLFTESSPYEE